MQRKIIFRSKCPFCDNNDEFIEWKHSGCQDIEYLYTDGDITCGECNKIFNLLDIRFSCPECAKNAFQDYNSYNELKTIINLILKKMDIDDDFKVELLYNITIRWHKRYK